MVITAQALVVEDVLLDVQVVLDVVVLVLVAVLDAVAVPDAVQDVQAHALVAIVLVMAGAQVAVIPHVQLVVQETAMETAQADARAVEATVKEYVTQAVE